ncbi:MAG: hypothetical protein ACYDHH_29625 [Solirubrobacteraceae bacterium]
MRETDVPMQVKYNKKHGYIHVAGRDDVRASAHQVRLDDSCGYSGRDMIILDFDKSWRLVGIEFLDANRSLPESVLNRVKAS